ncbi:MAG TPA: PASTA domain-containing protein, partial [Ilumatobacteraceae bacterium]|nr:PASTA domain-containing protein [Ilumatobacteraceae bacterium]
VAGVTLAEGGTILFVVSEGPNLSTLPDVTGMELAVAEQTLTAAKLQMRVDSEQFCESAPPASGLAAASITCPDVPAGSVISWRYEAQPNTTAGAEVMPGSVVAVVVSKGPAQRLMPELGMLDEVTATQLLAALGLVGAKSDDIFSLDVPAGQVAWQQFPMDQPLNKGDTVSFALSKGPEIVAIPTIEGQTHQQLVDAIAVVGLVVGAVTGPTDGSGTLQSVTSGGQPVASGQPLIKGSVIDIAYNDPPPPPPPSTDAPPTDG